MEMQNNAASSADAQKWYCTECNLVFNEQEKTFHSRLPMCQNHKIQMLEDEREMSCTKHLGQILLEYCDVCNECLCQQCTNQHLSHKRVTLNMQAQKDRHELNLKLNGKLLQIKWEEHAKNKLLDSLDDKLDESLKRVDSELDTIKNMFYEKLDTRRDYLKLRLISEYKKEREKVRDLINIDQKNVLNFENCLKQINNANKIDVLNKSSSLNENVNFLVNQKIAKYEFGIELTAIKPSLQFINKIGSITTNVQEPRRDIVEIPAESKETRNTISSSKRNRTQNETNIKSKNNENAISNDDAQSPVSYSNSSCIITPRLPISFQSGNRSLNSSSRKRAFPNDTDPESQINDTESLLATNEDCESNISDESYGVFVDDDAICECFLCRKNYEKILRKRNFTCYSCNSRYHIQCYLPRMSYLPENFKCFQCIKTSDFLALLDSTVEPEAKVRSNSRKEPMGLHGKQLEICQRILMLLYINRESLEFQARNSMYVKSVKAHSKNLNVIYLNMIKPKLNKISMEGFHSVTNFIQTVHKTFDFCIAFCQEYQPTNPLLKNAQNLKEYFDQLIKEHRLDSDSL